MGLTFSQFTSRIYDEVQNKNSRTLTVIKQVTVRQLKELSSRRVLFMEAAGSFATVANQDTYDATHTGFPGNAVAFDRLYYKQGVTNIEIPGPKTMDEVRFWAGTTSPVLYPFIWGFQASQLVIAPKPSSAVTLYVDWYKDATLDDSGAVITESSTTSTNPWFDRGELVLRYAVQAELYLMPSYLDEAAAGSTAALKNTHLATLEREYLMKKGSGSQAPAWLGGGEEPYRRQIP